MRASDPSYASLKWQEPGSLGPGVAVSALVHAGIIALGLVVWQNPPAFTPEDVIPVAIVADTPSAIGPETAAETVRTGEENSPLTVAEAPVSDTAPTPEPTPQETPTPPAAPAPQPAQKAPPPKPDQKVATPQPAPTKASTPKISPNQPAPSLPSKAKTTAPARPEPAFDFAAASAAASGADSGGRRAPKLAAAGQSAKQGRAGGGTLLAGDLESALRAQIYECWRLPAENSPRLVVTLQIELKPDGSLARDPKLIRPSSKAGADNKLLLAIEDALRAVRQCAPFSLPANRYEQWRLVNFDFDPRKSDRP